MLRSDLRDYSDAYIVIKGRITANFNPRKVYVNNDFLEEHFPHNIVPGENTAAHINTARAAATTAVVNDANNSDTRDLNKGISFRKNAPFTNCILKINNVLIGNAKYLDVLMPMYNLLEYRKIHEKNNRKFVELL